MSWVDVNRSYYYYCCCSEGGVGKCHHCAHNTGYISLLNMENVCTYVIL